MGQKPYLTDNYGKRLKSYAAMSKAAASSSAAISKAAANLKSAAGKLASASSIIDRYFSNDPVKIYIVLCYDKNTFIMKPFFVFDAALRYARFLVRENCRNEKEIFENNKNEEYLYFSSYSSKGDSVWITKHIVEN